MRAVAVFGLEGLDDGVAEEGGSSDEPQKRRRVGAKPAPDRVRPAELAQDGDNEDQEGF
jgi:hypothetical protein